MSNPAAPWVVLIIGFIVLLTSVVSGQRSGFSSMELIGILLGVAGVLAGLRWRRQLVAASRP